MTQETRRNLERIKRVTVLANENMYNLNPFIKRCATRHKDTLIEFIYVTGLEIPSVNVYRTSSQELAYHLTEQGFCIMLQTEENIQKEIIVYLPEVLGANQRQYLNLATSMLGNCDLSVFQVNSKDQVLDYCSDASKNVDTLIDFIKKIPSYKEENNKSKTLKRNPQ